MRVSIEGPSSSWMSLKEKGKRAYEAGDYETALSFYRSALTPPVTCSRLDQQVLLSNIVACRLHLGGSAHARAAVEDAKRCIALNPSWAKGHVRLASAYIALGDSQHSNDACNALQTALRLDPGNATARQMLIRELRRDHPRQQQATASAPTQPAAAAAAAQVLDDNRDFSAPPAENPHYQQQPADPPQDAAYFDQSTDATAADAIDDSISWTDRARYSWETTKLWYASQSDSVQLLVKVAFVILLLYIAFGGRFGLEAPSGGAGTNYRGNYGRDNAYDRYRNRMSTTTSNAASGSRRTSSNAEYSSSSSYSSDYYEQPSYTTSHDRSSYSNSYSSLSSSFDMNSLSYLFLLGSAMYIAHRNGVNPFHALWMMQMMGGRHRRYGGGFGGGGFGGWRYGGGGGMPHRRRW